MYNMGREGVQWISLPLHRPAKVEMRDEITPDPHVGVNESTEFGARKRGGDIVSVGIKLGERAPRRSQTERGSMF